MNKKYAVVIVTYNRLQLLKECINAVLAQTHGFDNIYVVNNKSTDGTEEYLATIGQSYDNIHVFNLNENIGGAGGFNYGLSIVKETDDYVLLIDDDAIIAKDFIEIIDSKIEDNIEAYSGTVYSGGLIDISHRRRMANNALLTEVNVPIEEYENESFLYDIASFCGLLISTSLINKIGLPRKDFFIWYDDSEYSMRLMNCTKIKNINAAKINHKAENGSFKGLSWKTYYSFRNQFETGKIHSSKPAMFVFRRKFYHVCGIVYYWFKSMIKRDRGYYYKNCLLLHICVLNDVKNHVMGKSDIFMPGIKLEDKIEKIKKD